MTGMLADPTFFLEQLFTALEKDGLELSNMELDHICYRVASDERYVQMNAHLVRHGSLISESMVGGRKISSYRLNVAFHFRGYSIGVVELPAPKEGSPYAEGYEHAEFVVPDRRSTEDLLAFTRRYPHLPWDLADLHKTANPNVRLRYAGISVKFHGRSLADVIAQELRDQR